MSSNKHSNKGFHQDSRLGQFEVVDMGKGKVGINRGVLTIGENSVIDDAFEGTAKPQNLLGGEIDEDKLLEVEKDDIVFILIIDDSTNPIKARVKKAKENELAGETGAIIKLAKIRDIETFGGEKYVDIQDYYVGDIPSTSETSPMPFQVSLFKTEPEEVEGEESESSPTWKARITPGYVCYQNPNSSASKHFDYIMPVIDGIPLDADEQPEIAVKSGDWLYVKVPVDQKGQKSETPSIIVGNKYTKGSHYQPPPSASSGEHHYAIAEIGPDGAEGEEPPAEPPELYVKTQFQKGGAIIHAPILWEGENVGGGAGEVFKERDNSGDKYLFRSLKQLGDGKPIIKPLPDPLAVDHIPIRSISGRGTISGQGDEQIKVEAEEGSDKLVVRGNGFNIVADGGITAMSILDGLVTSLTSGGSGGGYTGNVRFHAIHNPATGSQELLVLRLGFEEGRLTFVGMDDTNGATDLTSFSQIDFHIVSTDTHPAP